MSTLNIHVCLINSWLNDKTKCVLMYSDTWIPAQPSDESIVISSPDKSTLQDCNHFTKGWREGNSSK